MAAGNSAGHAISRRAFLRLGLAGTAACFVNSCGVSRSVETLAPATPTLSTLPRPVGADGVALAFWPLPRRDNRCTARSALKGAITAPAILARLAVHSLARPLLADLDGNGSVEIVVGGQAYAQQPSTCKCASMRDLWELPLRLMRSPIDCVAVWDLDQDGQLETIGWQPDESGRPLVVVYDAAGQRRWMAPLPEQEPGSLVSGWTIGHFHDKDTYDLYVEVRGVTTASARMCLSGSDGSVRWREAALEEQPGVTPAGYVAVSDVDADGVDDVVHIAGGVLESINGATGARIGSPADLAEMYPLAPAAELPRSVAIADIDGDARAEVLLSAGWAGIGLADLTGKALWRQEFEGPEPGEATPLPGREASLADIDGDSRLEVLCHLPDRRLRCFDALSGEVRWTLALDGGNPSELVAADIDGDGREEILFGTDLGRLYAVRATPAGEAEVLFSASLSGSVGSPVIGDIDGDGLAEIAVVCSDGYLNVLGTA